MAVSAPADRGRANEALLEMLADGLAVGRRDVELLSGRSGRDKVLVVKGLDEDSVRSRIAAMVESSAGRRGTSR